MFYLFRDECELKIGQPSSSKLSEPGVIEVINNNKGLVEPYSDSVNVAFLIYSQTSVLVGIPSHRRKMMMLKMNQVKLMSRQK